MEDGELRNEAGGLWIKDKQPRFEEFTMLSSHLIPITLAFYCRESRYFEDISKLRIFRLRTLCNFFQVCDVADPPEPPFGTHLPHFIDAPIYKTSLTITMEEPKKLHYL